MQLIFPYMLLYIKLGNFLNYTYILLDSNVWFFYFHAWSDDFNIIWRCSFLMTNKTLQYLRCNILYQVMRQMISQCRKSCIIIRIYCGSRDTSCQLLLNHCWKGKLFVSPWLFHVVECAYRDELQSLFCISLLLNFLLAIAIRK